MELENIRETIISCEPIACLVFTCEGSRSQVSVIGEDEFAPTDRKYLEYGRNSNRNFKSSKDENRTIIETLDLAWELLRMLPREG